MSDMLAAKIDVTKIDKTRLFEGKNGAKYLDVLLIPSTNSQYGDSHMIVQSVSKEDREAGKRGAILGNAKIIGGGRSSGTGSSHKPAPSNEALDEDVPF